MSIGLQLILSTTLVAASPGCSWAHPGANPYRGDPARALADFDLPPATRDQLRAMMAAHRYTDVATITRDDITGTHGYADLREMHSGRGRVCHGEVDRSAWSATHRERGLVYCADDACVIVPTICNNVALVSRKPERVAALDDGPIDIEPAAGPRPDESSISAPPLDFLPAPDVAGLLPDMPEPSGGELPGGDGPIGGGGPGGDSPVVGGGPDGGSACCDTPPILPIGGGAPPIAAVPEAPTWTLLLAGFALVFGRRKDAQPRSRSGCACAGHGGAK
jgi:hypothetical protein